MTEIKKDNFFKYLLDKSDNWGIQLITAGYYHARQNEKYPPPGHPETHEFEWENGRRLDGYYIIYIPTGTGNLDLKDNEAIVHPGDAILTFRNDWHRYKPHKSTGWEEYWVGFKGGYIEKYILEDLFPHKESYVKKIGYQSEVILLFNQLIELSKKNSPFFKKILPGCLLQLIAHFTVQTEEIVNTNRGSFLVEKTTAYIRKNLSDNVDFQYLAQSFNISYSRFRTIFKNLTGLAPNQFLINERIECAKRLLKNTEMNISQVAYKSGFQSPAYFTRIFQQKTGVTPSAERAKRT